MYIDFPLTKKRKKRKKKKLHTRLVILLTINVIYVQLYLYRLHMRQPHFCCCVEVPIYTRLVQCTYNSNKTQIHSTECNNFRFEPCIQFPFLYFLFYFVQQKTLVCVWKYGIGKNECLRWHYSQTVSSPPDEVEFCCVERYMRNLHFSVQSLMNSEASETWIWIVSLRKKIGLLLFFLYVWIAFIISHVPKRFTCWLLQNLFFFRFVELWAIFFMDWKNCSIWVDGNFILWCFNSFLITNWINILI